MLFTSLHLVTNFTAFRGHPLFNAVLTTVATAWVRIKAALTQDTTCDTIRALHTGGDPLRRYAQLQKHNMVNRRSRLLLDG